MAEEPSREPSRKGWVQLARYSHIGLALPAAVFIGWALGTLAARAMGRSWPVMAGVVLGAVAGFIELVRTLSAAMKE